jgi:hypothetical protein
MLSVKTLLLSLAIGSQIGMVTSGQTPVWSTISPESATIGVVMPAGTTYRFGDYTNNTWSDPTTVTVATTINPISMGGTNSFPFSDPDTNVLKELDVLETASPQSITVVDTAVSPTVSTTKIVPGLAPPAIAPSPIAFSVHVCGEPCTITAVSDPAAITFQYVLGTGVLSRYALEKANTYTVTYTFVKAGVTTTRVLTIPAYAPPVGTMVTVGSQSGTVTTGPLLPPSPIANSIHLCGEPCTVIGFVEATTQVFQYGVGTGPVSRYAIETGSIHTISYTFVSAGRNIIRTITIPAYVAPTPIPLVILGVVDNNGVFTPISPTGITVLPWPGTTTPPPQ